MNQANLKPRPLDWPDHIAALEHFAEQTPSLRDFLAGLLPQTLPALDATAGVIWLTDTTQNLRPAFHEHWHDLGITTDPQRAQLHRELINQTANKRQVLIVGPHNRPAAELPLLMLFAFVPLVKDDQLLGIVELVVDHPSKNDLPPELVSPELIEYLELLAGLVATFDDKTQPTFLASGTVEYWRTLDPLLLELYGQLDSRKLAYMAANAFQERLAVDRVSIFQCVGARPQLLAISGQAKVSGHSPLVKQLRTLTSHVVRSRQQLIHAHGVEPTHEPLADLLSNYLEQAGSQMLAITPLWSTAATDSPPSQPNQQQSPRRIVGVLVVERSRSSQFDAARQESLGLLADHLGNALQRAQQHEAVFLLPVWRAIGNSCRWLYRHQFWQSLAVLVSLAACVIALIAVPYDYRVTAHGALMPVVQRQLFAPWDSEVAELFVTGGEYVSAGIPLLRLESKELEAEEIRLRTLVEEKQTSLRALRSARDIAQRAGKTEEALEIEGRLAEHAVEIRHLTAQHELVKQRLQALLVTAPLDGQVATFQVDQLLRNRPVSRGDLLLEVMDPNAEWQLELKVEDRRMGHLLAAQQSRAQLPVEYILVTDPETSFSGQLMTVGLRANTDPELGNAVDLRATLTNPSPAGSSLSDDSLSIDAVSATPQTLPPLRIGATVTAKINCGPKPLGYVLFGDVIDYLRKTLWL